ncbi:FG-GAP repeat domain-containing protein [Streptomyces sp. NPDC058629]|uniref:FG-GAP repeat domain-containing protein n=1 Tax=Streptomyces sp. NPDC058629 TaxID=3346565 RepID=UPI003660DFF7
MDADFNGDGVRDTVIADPEATVGSARGAGVVHIVYGGGKGSMQLSQETAGVLGGSEAGDQFGYAVAVYDADADGCSDIAVGVPYEDLSTNEPAQGDVGQDHGETSGAGAVKLRRSRSGTAWAAGCGIVVRCRRLNIRP